MKSIIVISKDTSAYKTVQSCFQSEYRVEQALEKKHVFRLLHDKRYDLLFIDIEFLKDQGKKNTGYKKILQEFWHLCPSMEIVVMTSQEMIRDAVMAVKAGAGNYLTYPVNPEEIKYVTENIYETMMLQSELDYLRDQFWALDSLNIIQTKSRIMQTVYRKIRSVAPTKSTVLLVGETGTGKGVLANLIHQHSNRKDAQFISVHCGAIPDTLIESELFGHEKGAFTGAVKRKLGKFEIAANGTIFLDEIGTITPSAQIKLLQILQDGYLQRLGSEEIIKANIRIIAATNSDLKKMSDEGQFRKDLYYRLNVFPIDVPPLRERKEDIEHFIEVFLERLNKHYQKVIHDVHPQVIDALKKYLFPGNIRELENLIERAYILETSSILTPESFPNEIFDDNKTSAFIQVGTSISLTEARKIAIYEVEKHYLKELLSLNRGKINISAENAGITSRQLHKLMKKHGIKKEDFKAV
ncbi:MAG: sigma-54 dependent transcriptional regulator [Proteobacteria bacterium]|nr:sigma-54 dependent transcriptional regulator [Pseudomonadota bacterium]